VQDTGLKRAQVSTLRKPYRMCRQRCVSLYLIALHQPLLGEVKLWLCMVPLPWALRFTCSKPYSTPTGHHARPYRLNVGFSMDVHVPLFSHAGLQLVHQS